MGVSYRYSQVQEVSGWAYASSHGPSASPSSSSSSFSSAASSPASTSTSPTNAEETQYYLTLQDNGVLTAFTDNDGSMQEVWRYELAGAQVTTATSWSKQMKIYMPQSGMDTTSNNTANAYTTTGLGMDGDRSMSTSTHSSNLSSLSHSNRSDKKNQKNHYGLLSSSRPRQRQGQGPFGIKRSRSPLNNANTSFITIRPQTRQELKMWKNQLDRCSSLVFQEYYLLGEVIGSGCYAKVHKVRDIQTNEVLACKVIQRDATPKVTKLLKRECEILGVVDHPNIVKTYDVFKAEKQVYIVMEHMQKGSLFEYIRSKRRLDEIEALQITKEIAKGVAYLHSMGIIHQDIKSENVLMNDKNEYKLADFGLSYRLSPTEPVPTTTSGSRKSSSAEIASLSSSRANSGRMSQLSRTEDPKDKEKEKDKDDVDNSIQGTPEYLAPETIISKISGKESDMWAVGVLLYVMLAGRYPNHHRDAYQTLRQIATTKVSYPSNLFGKISPETVKVLKTLLSHDMRKRPSAEKLVEIIDARIKSLLEETGMYVEASLLSPNVFESKPEDTKDNNVVMVERVTEEGLEVKADTGPTSARPPKMTAAMENRSDAARLLARGVNQQAAQLSHSKHTQSEDSSSYGETKINATLNSKKASQRQTSEITFLSGFRSWTTNDSVSSANANDKDAAAAAGVPMGRGLSRNRLSLRSLLVKEAAK
mmetsp:Transcript_14311/g.24560  ORF Transcript_14311/g.24560 Transcript_14311/m.24560 type:complete len:704 (+) Transcript_14311:667-2778(+)